MLKTISFVSISVLLFSSCSKDKGTSEVNQTASGQFQDLSQSNSFTLQEINPKLNGITTPSYKVAYESGSISTGGCRDIHMDKEKGTVVLPKSTYQKKYVYERDSRASFCKKYLAFEHKSYALDLNGQSHPYLCVIYSDYPSWATVDVAEYANYSYTPCTE